MTQRLVLLAFALVLVLAPAASAHGLSYPDRFDAMSYPDYGDMLSASTDVWVEPGPFPAGNPPVVLEHSVTAAAVASDLLQEPMFLIRVGSTEYTVSKAGVKRVSDGLITGPAQYSR